MEFDPQAEVKQLKAQTALIKKRPYSQRCSKLDRYTYELLQLHRQGATVAELQRWLKQQRVKVYHSTITRWLARHG